MKTNLSKGSGTSRSRSRGPAKSSTRSTQATDIHAGRLTDILDSLLADCHLEVKLESLAFDLTASQYHALQVIGDQHLPMQKLAQGMLVSASTATRVVQQLIDIKLVSREADVEDRRTIWVHLTAKGLLRLRRIKSMRAENAKDILTRIDPKKHAALIEGLSLLEVASRQCHEAKIGLVDSEQDAA